ncbi:MAG: efflux RND transporter permease subunit [Myxococcota bacterium]
MLTWIIETSLRNRVLVAMVALGVLVFGLDATRKARLDVFPDFVPPQVTIQTEAPGLTPDQVELLVTTPLETTLGGVLGLETLRSESIQGLSVIQAVFREGVDVMTIRQAVNERVALAASRLPLGVASPTVEPLTSSTMDVLKIGLVSERIDAMALRDLATWTVQPKLLSVPGVARVNVFGGERRQLQIRFHPDELVARGLAPADVAAAARRATGVVGAGFVDTESQRITIRSEGESPTADILAEVLLQRPSGGTPVRLGDVAEVVETGALKFGDATVQGRPGVLLTVSSQYGSNTLEVTSALEHALDELQPLFDAQGVELFRRLHRPATFIETALGNLRSSLVVGAVLVALVLVPFLGEVRTAAISVVAIPLSLLGAVLTLEWLGATLDTMTLGGLAIAIGEVVDDAIIDVENIVHRLRENALRAEPEPVFQIVLRASGEVRGAVVHATLIVGLVFVPVLTLSGIAGRFFAPLAQAYLLAVSFSLLVALTVTPALCLLLFDGRVRSMTEPRLQTWLKERYERLLERVLDRPRPLVVVSLVASVLAIGVVPFLGGDFLPAFRESHLVLQISEAPGASIDEMLRIGGRVSNELLGWPEIATVEQQVGRAEQGEDTWGPHRSEMHVELSPAAAGHEEQVGDRVRAFLAGIPGIEYEVLSFLDDRVSETLTGETAPFVVNVSGTDLDALERTADRVAAVLQGVPGASEVRVKAPSGSPMLAVRLRPERLVAHGFQPMDVLDAVHLAYQGEVVAQVHRAGRPVDVVAILDEPSRREPGDVASLLVRGVGGELVPLGLLADVELTSGRESILHEDLRRRQSVVCVPRGRDAVSFANEAIATLRKGVPLPPGTDLEFRGTAQAQIEARRELQIESAAVAAGIAVVLWLAFRDLRAVALILVNVPFALVGGVLAILAAGAFDPAIRELTMGSLVGFITLFGITMRNSIVLISRYADLVRETGAAWGRALVVRGARDRVVPIVMTALVTGLGLLPLAVGTGTPGREIEGPMAIVILGGLASSTVLNLALLPVLAGRFGRFEAGGGGAGRR